LIVAVPNFVPYLGRKESPLVVNKEVHGSPLLSWKINTITKHHTQSSSPFSELAFREKVRLRAYEIYAKRGKGEGHDLDDRLKAEKELKAAVTNAQVP
jgi:hypothetical protein